MNEISLRDHFAEKALTGICAHPDCTDVVNRIASFSYEIADAMLAEREKHLPVQQPKTVWHDAEKEKPIPSKKVLIIYKTILYIGQYNDRATNGSHWYLMGVCFVESVSFWTELPELPKEKK